MTLSMQLSLTLWAELFCVFFLNQPKKASSYIISSVIPMALLQPVSLTLLLRRTLYVTLGCIWHPWIVILCWWANIASEQVELPFYSVQHLLCTGDCNWIDQWIISGHWALPKRVLLLKTGHMKVGEIWKSATSYSFTPWKTAVSPLQEKWLQASCVVQLRETLGCQSVRKKNSGEILGPWVWNYNLHW